MNFCWYRLQVPLKVATPLDPHLLIGQHLGLHGDHQYVNAGLAIALSSTWLQRTGHLEFNYLDETVSFLNEFFYFHCVDLFNIVLSFLRELEFSA